MGTPDGPNLASPYPSAFAGALGRMSIETDIYLGTRPDLNHDRGFVGSMALLMLSTAATTAEDAACYYNMGRGFFPPPPPMAGSEGGGGCTDGRAGDMVGMIVGLDEVADNILLGYVISGHGVAEYNGVYTQFDTWCDKPAYRNAHGMILYYFDRDTAGSGEFSRWALDDRDQSAGTNRAGTNDWYHGGYTNSGVGEPTPPTGPLDWRCHTDCHSGTDHTSVTISADVRSHNPAPDPQWLVGEEGSNDCPEGFEKISSPADCETAALATGFEFNDPPESYCCGQDKPSGCWAGMLNKVNFNDVMPGAAFARGRLLCRMSETEDPAAGGGGSPGDAGGATACGGSALRVHGGEAVRSPHPYTGNLDCEWLVTCPQSPGSPSHASLQFTSFSTETNTDVVHIFSGGIGSTTPLLVGGTGTRAHCAFGNAFCWDEERLLLGNRGNDIIESAQCHASKENCQSEACHNALAPYTRGSAWCPADVGTFSGNELPGTVTSASNEMYVHFVTDRTRHDTGFSAVVRCEGVQSLPVITVDEDPVRGSVIMGGGDAVYQLHAEAGTTYTIAVSLGTLPDSYMSLSTAAGYQVGHSIQENDDGTANDLGSRITNWQCPDTGTYIIAVRAFNPREQEGDFTVLVTSVQPAPPPPASGRWLVEAANTNVCSPGYEKVQSEAECESASRALGFGFNANSPYSNPEKPYGCWLGGSDKGNFSPFEPGRPHSGARPLCRMSEATVDVQVDPCPECRVCAANEYYSSSAGTQPQPESVCVAPEGGAENAVVELLPQQAVRKADSYPDPQRATACFDACSASQVEAGPGCCEIDYSWEPARCRWVNGGHAQPAPLPSGRCSPLSCTQLAWRSVWRGNENVCGARTFPDLHTVVCFPEFSLAFAPSHCRSYAAV